MATTQTHSCESWIVLLVCATLLLSSQPAVATDPAVYEPGVDPGVGFNLISWNNYGGTGATVWEDAVQSVYEAGFNEVSISPVRFFTPGVGSIASTSAKGPELSHIAAGITRAKSLGMKVTVNPFVEPVDFTNWRGFYDPSPGSGEWTTFWNDYQQYVVDVAQVAETSGADSMTVGTELRAITRNSGNNAQWSSVISSVDAAFTGSLGYAANWDNYDHSNVTSTIWENSAIDFIGIDSYFQGLLSNSQADASATYPNATFINQVESAWNNKLDNQILPHAAARKSGAGMPVKFTELGYLPYNRTTVTPQNSSGSLDSDEQNMAFEGLMRSLDGRLESDDFLAVDIWNWGMPGTGGNLWDMGVGGSEPQASNIQSTQWLADFVSNSVDPPPTNNSQVLYSFEDGLQGFFYPNFDSEPASTLAVSSTNGSTDGDNSLRISKPTSVWTWDARVEMTGTQLQALQDALADGIDDYLLEIDVTYLASELPSSFSKLDMHVSFESNLDEWSQVYPLAEISGPTDEVIRVQTPLNSFDLQTGISSASLHIGFSGDWSGGQSANLYIDRIALLDTTFVPEDNPDFNGDGVVDAADYSLWRDMMGQEGPGLAADGNSDGVVDTTDYDLWRSYYGAVLNASQAAEAESVPEPHSYAILCLFLVLLLRAAPRNALCRPALT